MSEPLADVSETNGGDPQPLSSDTLQVGDTVSEALLQRLAKLEKYEHKLAEVARVYRNLNTARKAIETVLKRLTPIQSIAEVEELEAHLSNLNAKSQVAGEQIGALTERDKASRLKITDLETQLSALRGAEQERGSLAKELDKVTKERKVVEGQLERSNQKLRLDVKALQSEISELRATPAVPDVDTLATQLLSQVPAASESEPLRELQTQLLVACGTPEGLVPATEVDEAVARASESHALELAQLKDILRKELATSEDRLKTASAESDKAIADLRLQLDSAPASEASGGGLTAERVGEIVAAALALKLELVSSEEPPPASQSAEVGGGKKKGKKKRKGTGTAPSPVVVPSEAVESDAAVKATQNEIAQLIALIESINDTSAKARESEATDTMVADLQAQIDQAQQSLSDQRQASDAQMALLSADVDAKALRIGELTEELRAAEARSSELTAELDTHKKRVDELAGALSATQEKCEKLTGELGAAEAKTVAIGEERTKLAQTLAKAQGASVRLEAQQSELQTQVTSLTKQLESARSRSNELQTSLERATADHAQAMARATAAEATVTGLEEHVRAVDADLANSPACTQCRLVRSNEHGATLDLYEEPSVYTTLANENNLGNHVLHIVKSKPTIPWRATYDMYLSTSVAPSSGVLVGRVVPTTVGGVYSILQRSTDPAQTQLADEVQWEEVCAVQYDSHVLGSTGPREMTVIVHAVSDNRGTGSLIDRYRAGADTDPGIVPLINKPPIYISETASYALDFGPRITTRSVKNFQLIHPHDKDYIVMQFGKSGPHSFALDIRYPMSPIMALGVAITSLDRKVIYNLSLPFFSSS
ncbi:hypothetical protein GGI18_001004 [Coemansia linderi]|uniref:Uncharacterized protein n=1 Tax=Coemansia linderi TaxID=2663919 RepID=A0ACC1KLP0_9FUNG|nr:hypothetical protein GGI18_001004 [Coemansia linderi]